MKENGFVVLVLTHHVYDYIFKTVQVKARNSNGMHSHSWSTPIVAAGNVNTQHCAVKMIFVAESDCP